MRLIRSSVEETLRHGELTTILDWLNALPEPIVRANSDLAGYKGWILYLRGHIQEAEAYAAAATESLNDETPPVHQGMLLAFRALLAIDRGELAQAITLGQQALYFLGNTDSFFRAATLSMLGQAQRLAGDRQTAVYTLRQAVSLGQRAGNQVIALEALGYLATLLYTQGQLREALALCLQAAEQYCVQGQPLPMTGMVHVPLGLMYYAADDLDRALYHLSTGITLAQQGGFVYYVLRGQVTLARLQYARGDSEAAWASLMSARQVALQSGNVQRERVVNAALAELQLRQDNLSAALRWVAEADLPPYSAPPARSEHEYLTYIRIRVAQNQPEAVQSMLAQMEQHAGLQGRDGSLITIHILQALTEHALNRPFAALDYLHQAIRLAAPEGYRRAFLDEGPVLAGLLSPLRHLAPAFVASLLQELPGAEAPVPEPSVVPSSPSSPSPAWPRIEPLNEYEVRILRLVAEGRSNQEIADRLVMTVGTIKWHLHNIYGKLDVSNRTEAVRRAQDLNQL
jgi:LuxR family maltose regulon positive regulatory protein